MNVVSAERVNEYTNLPTEVGILFTSSTSEIHENSNFSNTDGSLVRRSESVGYSSVTGEIKYLGIYFRAIFLFNHEYFEVCTHYTH